MGVTQVLCNVLQPVTKLMYPKQCTVVRIYIRIYKSDVCVTMTQATYGPWQIFYIVSYQFCFSFMTYSVYSMLDISGLFETGILNV